MANNNLSNNQNDKYHTSMSTECDLINCKIKLADFHK